MAAPQTTEQAGAARGGDVRKLAEMITGIKFAMLTTAAPDGTLHSRPMATQQAAFDGTLWFFTYADSGKVDEVRNDRHVNVSYADPNDNRYVSVVGRATVVRDRPKAQELWSEFHKAWFPKGLDDPNLALLRVDVDGAEYWDSPSSKMVQLYGYLKAKLTGQAYQPGPQENQKINL